MKRAVLPFILVCCTLAGPAQQWVQTNGPYAGYASAMITVGEHVYVSNRYYGQGDGRVYRSADLGATWVEADGGMQPDVNFVSQFANIGEVIIAAANHTYKTTDQGSNWAIKEAGLPVLALSIEAIGNEFWAGTNGAGIFKSTNLGESYVSMNTGILLDAGTVIVYDIAYLNGDIFLATEGGGGAARLYRSSDQGASWELANNGLPLGTNPRYFAVNGNTLFVSCNGDFAQYEYGLYRSDDNGDTWTPANNGIPQVINGNTGNVFAHEGVVYVSTTFPDDSPKVYTSIDNGASFTAAATGLRNDHQQAYSYTAAGDHVFAGLGWYGSVFRSSDQGASWEEARRGLSNSSVFSLIEHNGRLYAGAQEGLFHTENMGDDWTEVQNGLPFGLPITAMEKNGNTLYLGTDQFGLYRSTDAGDSWTAIGTGLDAVGASSIEDVLYAGGALYAATWNGVYKSTNEGASWVPASNGLPTEFGGGVVTVNTILAHGDTLFIGTVLERIFKSTNGGASWVPSGTGLPFTASTVHELVASGASLYAATDDGVYKSTNHGASWQILPTVNAGPVRALYAANGVLYASNHGPTVLTGYNVFVSADEGATWQELEEGLFPTARVRAFLLHNGSLFGATDTRSVWRIDNVLAVEDPGTEPGAVLAPNPASDIVRLSVPDHSGVIDLSVYNDLGSEVWRGTLRIASGSAFFDLQSLPPGLYSWLARTPDARYSGKLAVE